MPLLTYEQARPWARSIRTKVANREMPPWFIDRNVGVRRFKNDPSLTDAEVGVITRWVDSGAPQGSPADMPPPIDWGPSDRWSIKPNLIVNASAYTDDSHICTAAVHAGVITAQAGGTISVKPQPGRESYPASTANGVTTLDYGSWQASYTISAPSAGK